MAGTPPTCGCAGFVSLESFEPRRGAVVSGLCVRCGVSLKYR